MQKAQRDHAIKRIDEVVQKHEMKICGVVGHQYYRSDQYNQANAEHGIDKLFPFNAKPYASKAHILKAISSNTFAFIDAKDETDIFKTIVPNAYAKAWYKVQAARHQELKQRKERLEIVYHFREATIDKIMLGDEKAALEAIEVFRKHKF